MEKSKRLYIHGKAIMSKNVEIIKNLNPYEVFKYFAEISDLPRGSGNSEKIAKYLVDFAVKNNLQYKLDNYNNVIIIKKTANNKKATIALQAHTDMVCVKTKKNPKDMVSEGIDLVIDGEWLKANDTTLGADDGIGIAIILSILSDETDYERDVIGIFTSDEEIGLIGAHKIDLSNLDIKYLINIDNEKYDVIDVGCAGGTQLEFEKKCKLIEKASGKLLNIKVDGLLGGHSGMEITKNRGNANIILAEILYNLIDEFECNLVSINGGHFNNAIPNQCEASIIINDRLADIDIIRSINLLIAEEYLDYENDEKELNIIFNMGENDNVIKVLSDTDTKEVLSALFELPDGLISTFETDPNTAETSLNLGVLKTKNDIIYIEYLVRSNINVKREKLNEEVFNIANKYQFKKVFDNSYPAWEYKKTKLEEYTFNFFKELFGIEPTIEITHGGLECGILLEKLQNADAIAIGPTIYGAHTVFEKLKISTVQNIKDLIHKLIIELS